MKLRAVLGCAVLSGMLFLQACDGLSSRPSDETVTKLACIRVLRWNHDPSAQSKVLRSSIGDIRDYEREGWDSATRIMESVVAIITNNDTGALANWESSEPCQAAKAEAIEKYGLE